MPTIQETVTAMRDAAHINANAIGLILTEAEGQFEAIRLWADSSVKRTLLNQLSNVIIAYRNAKLAAERMKSEANEALQSYTTGDVPQPPAYPEIPTAGGVAQWSQRDW